MVLGGAIVGANIGSYNAANLSDNIERVNEIAAYTVGGVMAGVMAPIALPVAVFSLPGYAFSKLHSSHKAFEKKEETLKESRDLLK